MLRINIENGDAHFSSRFILDPWHIHTHILKLLSILFTAQQHTALLHYQQRALHLLSTCVEKLLSCTTVFAALPGPEISIRAVRNRSTLCAVRIQTGWRGLPHSTENSRRALLYLQNLFGSTTDGAV